MMKLKIYFALILLITISSIGAFPGRLGNRVGTLDETTSLPDLAAYVSSISRNKLNKRTTQFEGCDPRIPTLTVTTNPPDLTPNTNTAFNISGKLDSQLTDKSKLFISVLYSDWTYDYGFSGGVCQYVSCPYPANTDFTIKTAVGLKDLPNGYILLVALFTDYDQSHDRPSACARSK